MELFIGFSLGIAATLLTFSVTIAALFLVVKVFAVPEQRSVTFQRPLKRGAKPHNPGEPGDDWDELGIDAPGEGARDV